MKTCTRCKINKDEKEFNKNHNRPDGLQCWCRACCIEKRKNNYYSDLETTRKHKREYAKQYRIANIEKLREHDRKSYQRNREEQLKKASIYREKNRATINRKQIIKARKNGIPPRKGYVYIVHFPHELDGRNYYKIGQSISPRQRLIRLSSHSPVPVELNILIYTEDMSLLESELHHKFQNKQSNLEWYFLDNNDICYILKNYPCLIPPFD